MQLLPSLPDPWNAAEEIVERFSENGAPPVQILNRLLDLKMFLASLQTPVPHTRSMTRWSPANVACAIQLRACIAGKP